ncbi:uncharacterized protein [Nicotiana sylvestris]|uniref:uncharacterized protein n=1 Tax=Nicotiana sylvestris TaxID=4096 RepID=UPI00388CE4D1
MYQDLRQHYWWRRMKKDIVEYVVRCLNCKQVKCEHQRSGGLLQKLEILELKWEQITMDFVVGLPRTQQKFDAVWVIMDRLTNWLEFISVRLSDFMACRYLSSLTGACNLHHGSGEPYNISWRVGEVAYELALPPSLVGVHSIFHVLMLRKYHGDPSHVLDFSSAQLDKDLSYVEEPVAIVDRQVRKLRSKNIASVKKFVLRVNEEEIAFMKVCPVEASQNEE